MSPQIYPDEDWRNADWLRSLSWNVMIPEKDGTLVEVTTADQLLRVLKIPEGASVREKNRELQAFLRLPAARPMPPRLRRELEGRGLKIVEKSPRRVRSAFVGVTLS